MMDANAAQHPGRARSEDEQQHWLGGDPSLYRSDMQRPASEIEVARFRQILIWPLALQAAEETNGLGARVRQLSARKVLNEIRNDFCSTPWGPALEDPPEDLAGVVGLVPPPHHPRPQLLDRDFQDRPLRFRFRHETTALREHPDS